MKGKRSSNVTNYKTDFWNIHVLSKFIKRHENSRTVTGMRVIRMHKSIRPLVKYSRDTKGSLGFVIAMATRCIMA